MWENMSVEIAETILRWWDIADVPDGWRGWFTADVCYAKGAIWQRCKCCGRAGRAGRRLRPLFNRTAAAQRPVVIPSWRATPVSLLWPRVSCSPAVSPNLYLTFQTPSISRRHAWRELTSAKNQWLRQYEVLHISEQWSCSKLDRREIDPCLYKVHEWMQPNVISLRLRKRDSGVLLRLRCKRFKDSLNCIPLLSSLEPYASVSLCCEKLKDLDFQCI